ncbi:MAG: rhomboid family intramembrane serine protease [Gaiellaceae bacterium]
MDEPLHCYRHPNRETRLACSECGRPICTECMHHAPVGIRCPEHANVGAVKPNAARTVRQVRGTITTHPAPVTAALVAINVVVYLITVAQGNGLSAPGGKVFEQGVLVGILVGHGDYWRLFTVMFLHASVLHIAFNMFALWWLGSIVEQLIGPLRFLLVYFASGLAGSAGALIVSGLYVPTVGASGAIFGIMGALLILEFMQTGSLAGQAMSMIVINIVISFSFAGISIGGHIGGLIGGIVGTFALAKTRYMHPHWIGPALVVGVGVVSVAVGIARAKGTI